MHIKYVEIQNFRKLKSIRIEFSEKKTLFVGANNSGKTSAMDALISFLSTKKFSINDFTLSNWVQINKIGSNWEKLSTEPASQMPTIGEWEKVLPTMDIWLQVAGNEIHRASHLLPTLAWEGGLLGVRLRFEPKKIEEFYKEYRSAWKDAHDTINKANKNKSNGKDTLKLWPKTMVEFLDRKLESLFTIRAYILDPSKRYMPKNGIAQPQPLPENSEYLDDAPLDGLIRIDYITAQRGFSDVDNDRKEFDSEGQRYSGRVDGHKLSVQLRKYYNKHLDPSNLPNPSDIDALRAIDEAQNTFDDKLKESFKEALKELEGLGYPGITDPRLTISTKIRPMDGLGHESAVQFQVVDPSGEKHEVQLRLPEKYNGLGYQNLISMVFKLMSFRDGWMRVGKAEKAASTKTTDGSFALLHLVLVEEPEAHLHAQVQQVFIRKAYEILRNHENLKDKVNLETQLIVSTHSSHIAHECEFSCLRYFRRLPAQKGKNEVPTTTVENLSEAFGEEQDTKRFVTRYLKTTHCDLFFADAAILVEGSAERMLIPHFIRTRKFYKELNQSYISILEIGGSHAHRLKPLIDQLGLVTLIITDLDACEDNNRHSVQPVRGKNQVTRNSTIKKWVPKEKLIDKLTAPEFDLKVYKNKEIPFYSVRVAYQCPVKIKFEDDSEPEEVLSNTFEDALVYDNISLFRSQEYSEQVKEFRNAKKLSNAINDAKSTAELGDKMFEALKKINKAEFALEMLYLNEPDQLNVPTYIKEGLLWLQEQLKIKQEEVFNPEENHG